MQWTQWTYSIDFKLNVNDLTVIFERITTNCYDNSAIRGFIEAYFP